MDKKAKQILFKTYWHNGWIEDSLRTTSPADFEYAKAAGLMFDPLTITHDQCLDEIFKILPEISASRIAQAFLSSLSARRLDWRSGLASYFIATQLSPHRYNAALSGQGYNSAGQITHCSYTCGICRASKYGIIGDKEYKAADLNVLNFERIKWGGVRHGDLLYTLFDLQQFERAVIPAPTEEDILLFRAILATIKASLPSDYPSTLEKNLGSVIKSTKEERQILIEILACIGILKPGSYDRPSRGKGDWVFAEYWRGEDGCNEDAVLSYFGEYINENAKMPTMGV